MVIIPQHCNQTTPANSHALGPPPSPTHSDVYGQFVDFVSLIHPPGNQFEIFLDWSTEDQNRLANFFLDSSTELTTLPRNVKWHLVKGFRTAHSASITLNQISIEPDVQRSWMHYRARRSTRNDDVIRRQWFLIDIDPIDSRAQVRLLSRQVVRLLCTTYGFPRPAIVSSGNGCYLLFRVDLPNSDEIRDLFRSALRTLAHRFKDFVGAEVDPQTYHARQTIRIATSWNRKREPHSRVELLQVPSNALLTAEQIRAFVTDNPVPASPRRPQSYSGGCLPSYSDRRFLLREYLQGNGIEVIRTSGDKICVKCPFCGKGAARGDAAFFDKSPPGFKCFRCDNMSIRDVFAQSPPQPYHYDPPLPERGGGLEIRFVSTATKIRQGRQTE